MPNHITNELRIGGVSRERAIRIFKGTIGKTGHFDFNAVVPMPKSLDIEESSIVEALAFALEGKVPEFLVGRCSTPEEVIRRVRDDMCSGNAKHYAKALSQAKMSKRNFELYGHRSWYTWSRDMWGTKWNAYNQHFPFEIKETKRNRKTKHKTSCYRKRLLKKRIEREMSQGNHEDFVIRFDTAWSMPMPVFALLSTKCPDSIVNVKYADEDIGSNCGWVEIVDGDVIKGEWAGSWSAMTEEEKFKWRKFAIDLKYQIEDEDDRIALGYDENYNHMDDEDE